MVAYEDMIRNTSTEQASWHVIPADNRWFARIVIAATIVETLDGLNLKFPVIEGKALAELKDVRRALKAEGGLSPLPMPTRQVRTGICRKTCLEHPNSVRKERGDVG